MHKSQTQQHNQNVNSLQHLYNIKFNCAVSLSLLLLQYMNLLSRFSLIPRLPCLMDKTECKSGLTSWSNVIQG